MSQVLSPESVQPGSDVGVWIDHSRACVVAVGQRGAPQVFEIFSEVEPHHRSTGQSGVPPPGHVGGNLESRYQRRRQQELERFYDRVIAALAGCRSVLVMGPGQARRELYQRLRAHPALGGRILGVQTAPKLSLRQMAARVRETVASSSRSGTLRRERHLAGPVIATGGPDPV